MTERPLLDTHVWVWWMLGDPRLKPAEREILDGLPGGQRPVLCDISLWEVALLVHVGRLELEDGLDRWLDVAASPGTVEVRPIMPDIVVEMTRLPATFHHDPADRLIVATARAFALPLATHDARIRRSRLATLWSP
ncbi:MAG: type II toxin-antitoxin system VapC family toxin [Planctomycetota bacterium]